VVRKPIIGAFVARPQVDARQIFERVGGSDDVDVLPDFFRRDRLDDGGDILRQRLAERLFRLAGCATRAWSGAGPRSSDLDRGQGNGLAALGRRLIRGLGQGARAMECCPEANDRKHRGCQKLPPHDCTGRENRDFH
jgi:hypothetical protein